MDHTAFNWNEQDKINNDRLKFFKKRDYVVTKIGDTFFFVGLAITIVALVTSPTVYNIVIAALYLILGIFRKIGLMKKKYAAVVDTAGNPIPHSIVRLHSLTQDREVKHTVADKYGRFHMIVANGTYRLTVEKPSGQDTYETIIEYPQYVVSSGIVKGEMRG